MLILFLATAAVYSVTFTHVLLGTWDDFDYLVGNKVVHGFTVHNIKTAFSSFFIGNYAPVNIVSFMIDHTLWQLHPAGYHLENVTLHAMNGMLVYLLLIRQNMQRTASFLAASIFLFHPVQVESVAWVSERKNLLTMLFFLLAWHCYISYRKASARQLSWYLASLAAVALSLLTKSIAVIFPIAILLHDHCFPGNRKRNGTLRDKIPYLLLAVAGACVTMVSQAHVNGGGRRDYPGGSPLAAFYTMLPVLASYLKDCFLPLDLLPFYMVRISRSADVAVVMAGLILLFLIAGGTCLWRYQRQLFFYYALFFLALLPVSQIVPLLSLKNDRYLYFPLIGFAGFVVQALFLLKGQAGKWGRIAVPATLVILVLSLPPLALRQARIWRDDVTLWSHTVRKDPDNMMGWLQLAKAYTTQGDGPAARAAIITFHRLTERYGPLRGYEDQ